MCGTESILGYGVVIVIISVVIRVTLVISVSSGSISTVLCPVRVPNFKLNEITSAPAQGMLLQKQKKAYQIIVNSMLRLLSVIVVWSFWVIYIALWYLFLE